MIPILAAALTIGLAVGLTHNKAQNVTSQGNTAAGIGADDPTDPLSYGRSPPVYPSRTYSSVAVAQSCY